MAQPSMRRTRNPSPLENITVAYLTSLNPKLFKGRFISGAMTYAAARVNSDPDLLPGHWLHPVPQETGSDALVGVAKMSELWRRGAVAFFGPEDSCEVEGRVASAWNLPLFAYVSRTSVVLLLIWSYYFHDHYGP